MKKTFIKPRTDPLLWLTCECGTMTDVSLTIRSPGSTSQGFVCPNCETSYVVTVRSIATDLLPRYKLLKEQAQLLLNEN